MRGFFCPLKHSTYGRQGNMEENEPYIIESSSVHGQIDYCEDAYWKSPYQNGETFNLAEFERNH